MRTLALLLLLVAALIYMLPDYRGLVPVEIPLPDSQAANAAAALLILGIVGLVWSRR